MDSSGGGGVDGRDASAEPVMRLLVSSDWHLDAATAGVERLPELEAYVDALVARLRVGTFDAFVHLGDFFDPGSLQECRLSATLFSMVERVHEAVGRSIWIAGNHDVVESSSGWSVLSPLSVASRAGWCGDPSGGMASPDVLTVPTALRLDYADAIVLALPYVSRAAERDPETAERLADALAAARSRSPETRLVVLGHFTIPGIVPGSEEEMVRGRDAVFPADAIASLRPDLVLNGHYHARQTVACGGVRIEIPGAPLRMTFGERDDGERGWLEVEL